MNVMDHRERYFFPLARKLSNRLGKPPAIIAAGAFLLIWTAIALFIDLPPTVYLIASLAISGITLLMVVLLHNAHQQDIRALQARIEELAAERRHLDQAPADSLTEAELQQVRDLLQHSNGNDIKRRPDRDKRPSLF
jgi:low affinity Fe/Cu permease